MSNYGIIRIEKYTAGSVRGVQIHDRREREHSNTNGDIRFSESYKNYNLIENQCHTFSSAIKKRLQEINVKPRNNAVVMCQALCTASPDFFKGKSEQEIKEYFEECLEFLSNKYGKHNIVSAFVHLDEKTPHMHVNFVPITKDNRLSARDLTLRGEYKKLQNEAFEKVFKNHGLERGRTDSKVKHISTLNYKIITLKEKEQKMLHELLVLQQRRDNNELYILQRNLKSLREKLSKMFEVLESDPELMKEYKIAIERLKARKNRNNEDMER